MSGRNPIKDLLNPHGTSDARLARVSTRSRSDGDRSRRRRSDDPRDSRPRDKDGKQSSRHDDYERNPESVHKRHYCKDCDRRGGKWIQEACMIRRSGERCEEPTCNLRGEGYHYLKVLCEVCNGRGSYSKSQDPTETQGRRDGRGSEGARPERSSKDPRSSDNRLRLPNNEPLDGRSPNAHLNIPSPSRHHHSDQQTSPTTTHRSHHDRASLAPAPPPSGPGWPNNIPPDSPSSQTFVTASSVSGRSKAPRSHYGGSPTGSQAPSLPPPPPRTMPPHDGRSAHPGPPSGPNDQRFDGSYSDYSQGSFSGDEDAQSVASSAQY